MLEILTYTISAIIQFIVGIYNIRIEFFRGQLTKIGDLVVAVCLFVLLLSLVLNLLGIGKDDD